MKTMHNAVTLGGNLGSAVEVNRLSTGNCVVRVPIATNEIFKDKEGQVRKQTQWHNLVAWGDTAERMQMYLAKGSFVIVHGKLVYRPYLDRDGNTQYITEVVVREFTCPKLAVHTTAQTAA
jgi:single-strand DNA-binding protein